jgi:RNA-directed DNA polymerase
MGVEGFVEDLQQSLKTGSYRPAAVRRVWIPKPDGRKRPLGIPTIRDRVAQTAMLLVIEPIFEADFMDCSYGFRPGRSAHDALGQVRKNLQEGLKAVYDADLKGYFDSIPHDKLIKCLRMRITDRSVLGLIRMWLQAPVQDGKQMSTPKGKGTPQGGVISPLLANVYLHWFEKVFHFADGPANWAKARIVRYADDFVVHARYQGSRIGKYIEQKLESWLGLEINRDKTKVVDLGHPGTQVNFLGYTFSYDRSLYGRGGRYLNVTPSKKALKAQRQAIRDLVNCHQRHVPVRELIKRVNRQLLGWSRYFSFGYPRKAMRAMNWFVRKRLIAHLQRRSQRRYLPKGRSYDQHLKDLGLIYL